MNEFKGRNREGTDEKKDRREFFKQFGKYLLGFTAFGIASLLGLKHDGELRLGKMKNTKLGLSEAHGGGQCGFGSGCAGGGGMCGFGSGCAGS